MILLFRRCSTKRQEDTSESVVFHFLLLGVGDCCLFVCVWLLCFACFVFWFPQTPCVPFHLSPISGDSQSKTKRFYDRLSFERGMGKKKNCLAQGHEGSRATVGVYWLSENSLCERVVCW